MPRRLRRNPSHTLQPQLVLSLLPSQKRKRRSRKPARRTTTRRHRQLQRGPNLRRSQKLSQSPSRGLQLRLILSRLPSRRRKLQSPKHVPRTHHVLNLQLIISRSQRPNPSPQPRRMHSRLPSLKPRSLRPARRSPRLQPWPTISLLSILGPHLGRRRRLQRSRKLRPRRKNRRRKNLRNSEVKLTRNSARFFGTGFFVASEIGEDP